MIALSEVCAGAWWTLSYVSVNTTDWSLPLMRLIHTGATSTFLSCSQFRVSSSSGLAPHHS